MAERVIAQIVKLARRRDPSVPVGQAAPLHVICPCGTRVPVPERFEIKPGGLEFRCPECDRRIGADGWLLEDDRDRQPPTWTNQLWRAGNETTAELRRHADVSKGNAHRCTDCFCCAALTVIERRAENH